MGFVYTLPCIYDQQIIFIFLNEYHYVRDIKAYFIRLDYLLDLHWKGRKKVVKQKSFKTVKIHVLLAVLHVKLSNSPQESKNFYYCNLSIICKYMMFYIPLSSTQIILGHFPLLAFLPGRLQTMLTCSKKEIYHSVLS